MHPRPEGRERRSHGLCPSRGSGLGGDAPISRSARGQVHETRRAQRSVGDAILFGRLGRVVVPVVQVGERLLVGHDPVQLARFLPREDSQDQHVSFGASVRTVTSEIAKEKQLPATYGVEVGQVKPGSPAEAAGILPGDVITGIGPYTVNGGADQFRRAVSLRQPGDTMILTIWREGDVIRGSRWPFPSRRRRSRFPPRKRPRPDRLTTAPGPAFDMQ